MVKGIISAFDHMELCFVINLKKDGNWAVTWPPIIKYLLPAKKLISNTDQKINFEISEVCNDFGKQLCTVNILKIGTLI